MNILDLDTPLRALTLEKAAIQNKEAAFRIAVITWENIAPQVDEVLKNYALEDYKLYDITYAPPLMGEDLYEVKLVLITPGRPEPVAPGGLLAISATLEAATDIPVRVINAKGLSTNGADPGNHILLIFKIEIPIENL